MPKNFLLGFGERLTERMDPPKIAPTKELPYTFQESVKRIESQLTTTLKTINALPDLACPRDQSVVAVVLHPEFTAKSYFPEALFRYWGLEQIGSRSTKIKPDKWTKKTPTSEVVTTEIFVTGEKKQLNFLPALLNNINPNSTEGMEISKIEQIKPLKLSDKVLPIHSTKDKLTLEVVLHASTNENYRLDGFKEYLKYIDDNNTKSEVTDFIFSKGLCFLSLETTKANTSKIAEYSFLRVLREMPPLRKFEPLLRSSGVNFPVTFPDILPVDPNLRVAIFDGGFPDNSPLDKWVTKREVGKLGNAITDGINHGQWVSSAFLFGSLVENVQPPQPYAFVDLYRIFDTDDDSDTNSLKAVKRIKDILESTNYNFINISCGPDLPIEDTEVHAWTSILDEVLSSGSIIATISAGNKGHLDWTAGNARIQPPSDCINGLCVGATNIQGNNWERANYSCIGPGRLPGYIKPDLLSFGGSSKELFWVLHENGYAAGVTGTSFSAPFVLRAAAGIRSSFGSNLGPLAIKTLLIHSSNKENHDTIEVGWGRLNPNIEEITSCEDHCIKVVYQGKLKPGEWLKIPVPVPANQIEGKLQIKATMCYASTTDPQDSVNYTQSGLEIVFRPHEDRKKDPKQEHADSKPFFSASKIYDNLDKEDKRFDSHRWETTVSASRNMFGRSLKNPAFNVHYIARDSGNKSKNAEEIPYALVVEINAPSEPRFYNQVFNRFRTLLEILKPTIEVKVTV